MPRVLLLLAVFVLILLAGGVGAWWYLFGEPVIPSDELVPADTVAFASIPNGAAVLAGYQSSQLKTLVDSPNAQPILDLLSQWIGDKNASLLWDFLPNLSGQSFVAAIQNDPDHPEKIGFIAAMKPKPGLGNFDAFVEQVKATWPELPRLASTGTGSVSGFDYQWIQGPGRSDKICVAQIHGWIVMTSGEGPLQDWIARYEKKATTSSLAQNPDYQKAISQLGKDPLGLVYVDDQAGIGFLRGMLAKTNGAAAEYLAQRVAPSGGAALGTWFLNGEIIDSFSIPMPTQAQHDSGLGATPCPFETLNFTGHDTLLYWASSIDFSQYWKTLQAEAASSRGPAFHPLSTYVVQFLQTWAQSVGLDVQRDLIAPLGSEISVQAEWDPDTSYPDVGLFIKLDKPDAYKPVIADIIESARRAYEDSAVIKEVSVNDRSYATLTFIQSSPFNPTITENGPYLGFFLTPSHAVHSFTRDPNITLVQNSDFARQIGGKRNGASQLVYVDSPRILDRTYRTALPYLSLAAMFNRNLAEAIKGKTLPDDLTWLAPMGTWSFVLAPDDAGIHGYSISGIGNQGIYYAAAGNYLAPMGQSVGWLPKLNALKVPAFVSLVAPPTPAPTTPGATTNAPPQTNAPPAMDTDAPPAPASDASASTNATPLPPGAPKP
jgi:hypothetical protein